MLKIQFFAYIKYIVKLRLKGNNNDYKNIFIKYLTHSRNSNCFVYIYMYTYISKERVMLLYIQLYKYIIIYTHTHNNNNNTEVYNDSSMLRL